MKKYISFSDEKYPCSIVILFVEYSQLFQAQFCLNREITFKFLKVIFSHLEYQDTYEKGT